MAGEELRGLVAPYARLSSPVREESNPELVQTTIPSKMGKEAPLTINERKETLAESKIDSTPYYQHPLEGSASPPSRKPVSQTFTSSSHSALTNSSANSIQHPPLTIRTDLTQAKPPENVLDEYSSLSFHPNPSDRPTAALLQTPEPNMSPLNELEYDYSVPSGDVRRTQQTFVRDNSDSEDSK